MRNKINIREAPQSHQLLSAARLFPGYVNNTTDLLPKQGAKEIKSQDSLPKEAAIWSVPIPPAQIQLM